MQIWKISRSDSYELLLRCAVTDRATLHHPQIFYYCDLYPLNVHDFPIRRTLAQSVDSQYVT